MQTATQKIQTLAQLASCDERTVRRWLLGEPVRALVGQRLNSAAQALAISSIGRLR